MCQTTQRKMDGKVSQKVFPFSLKTKYFKVKTFANYSLGEVKEKKLNSDLSENGAPAKNNRGSGRAGRGRHRSRGSALARSRSAPRDGIIDYTDFIAPVFTTGLADYGAQDSPFVTPIVGMAVGGVGLSHVPTNIALLVPAPLQLHSKPVGDASVVKDLVRKQV